jgi:16S rRNA (guanine966-N2)-methyltransferase
MRVIAGEAKGRTLVVPRGGGTRAATDRIRETLFAILEPELPDAKVLDLFAGAGTLGIEALSRGASAATFVERDAQALKALRQNLETTRLAGRAHVVPASVKAFLDAGPGGPFDIAFVDPPFVDVAGAEATLGHNALGSALAADGLVVVRSLRKHAPAVPASVRIVRAKNVGEETLLFMRYGLAGRRPEEEPRVTRSDDR